MAAGIVVGIGFIGAGTIIRRPAGMVTGITTAATIWVVAGVGFVGVILMIVYDRIFKPGQASAANKPA